MKLKSLVLGTANFSESYRLSRAQQFSTQEILKAAFENGIDCLDVSNTYDGAYREINKSKLSWKLNAKIVLSNQSSNFLKEVKQKVVDLLDEIPKAQISCLMIHNSSKLSNDDLEIALDAMNIVGNHFGIKNVGLSLYPDEEYKVKMSGLNTIQVPVSVLDQRICSSFIASNKFNNLISVQARSIFLRGLLSNSDISQSVVGKKYLVDLKIFHEWCKSNEVDLIFACINFVYHLSFIDTIVLGVNSKIELVNNIKAVNESKEYKINTNFSNFKSENLELIDPRRWEV